MRHMLAVRELCNSTAQEFLFAQEPNEARFQTTLRAANFLFYTAGGAGASAVADREAKHRWRVSRIPCGKHKTAKSKKSRFSTQWSADFHLLTG